MLKINQIGTKELSTFVIISLIIVFLSSAAPSPNPLPPINGIGSNPLATTITGKIRVNGHDLIVSMWVAVSSQANAHGEAQAALHRAYPDAIEVKSDSYSTIGLYWDIFADSNPDNDQVPVYYNGSVAPSYLSGHRSTWATAMNTWNKVSTSSFLYVDAGNTSRCPSMVEECAGSQFTDGYNDFTWIDIRDSSVLGVAWHWSGVDEIDIALDNNNFSWYIGSSGGIPSNAFDVQTVSVHEFGHGLGLGHSGANGSVMEPYYSGVRRSCNSDDISGITTLYPVIIPEVTPTPTPTPTPDPNPKDSTVSVTSITYRPYGGREGNKHIQYTLSLIEDSGNPVAGANVAVKVINTSTSGSWMFTNSTKGSGKVNFTLRLAPEGCYNLAITQVEADNLTWDGVTPEQT